MTEKFFLDEPAYVRKEHLAGDLDDFLSQQLPEPKLERAADPFNAVSRLRTTIGHGGSLYFGRVQYLMPTAGWYRVAVAGLNGLVSCCALETGSSPSLFGCHSTGSYQPHDEVLVLLTSDSQPALYGVIIGATPTVVDDGNVVHRDWVSQGSNVGILRDGYYTKYLTDLDDEGGVIDFGGFRPLDQTSMDWGVGSSFGPNLHLDPFMAFLRVDELCGIELHYADQHLCLSGYSFDSLTAAQSTTHRDDEGEATYHLGESPYPWELLGKFSAGASASREYADADVHYAQPYGKLEPEFDDQQPFFRYEEYGGYLGQGRIRQISLPPPQVTSQDTYRLSGELQPICVFREHVGMDGSYFLSAAKQVVIAKRSLAAYPRRQRLQDDDTAEADSSANDNYRFAGQYGTAADEHVVQDLELLGDHQELLSTAAILDSQAYAAAWKSLHQFSYHTGDFVLPEELPDSQSQTNFFGPQTNQYLPNFGALASSMWLPRPEAKPQYVDHRYQEVNYYEVLQHLSFTDDGGVVLQGGHGEEIRFVQGSIEISCPGNVHIRTGRTTAVLAGDDLVLRARNSVDVTATEKDMRCKSQRNMQFLSGNGGTGGLLLENKAQSRDQDYPPEGGEAINASGIVFKSAQSIVATLAKEIYLRTGNKHIGSGNIVLDAAKGEADVIVVAGNLDKFVSQAERSIFRIGGVNQTVTAATTNGLVVGSGLAVSGTLRVEGEALIQNGVRCSDGHFQSPQGGEVNATRNPQVVRYNITSNTSEQVTSQKEYADELYDTELRQLYYASTQIGSDDQGKEISVSLREESDYGTSDFSLADSHYQVLLRNTGGGSAWQEQVVKYQDEREQMPWPGKKKWAEEPTLQTLPAGSFNLYDVVEGAVTDRQRAKDPKLGPFVPRTPNSDYQVI